ncbi:MAG TPA: transposase [Spirochaetia bacterium]|nr:transposase [Spirochaetia bacterium]
MRFFIVPDRKRKLLLTEVDLDTNAPLGSALRYIDELVDMFDTGEIEKTYDIDSEQGRNPIHPKTYIKVGLYALYNCRFSLRKMEYNIEHHLGYKWLTGDKAIDHSTLGKFYARYIDEIVELFSQVVMLCKEQDLIVFDILAIDSVKLRANASYKQSKTLASIEREQKKIKERLRQLIEAATREQNPAYSVTTATDTANDIITHFQVNPQDDNEATLLGSVEGSRRTK